MWQPTVNVSINQIKEHFIHFYVTNTSGNFLAYVIVVYAKNSLQEMIELWNELKALGANTGRMILTGYFDVVLLCKDKIGSLVI